MSSEGAKDRPATAYKVLTGDEMTTLERDGTFAGSAADVRDGFIHLSTAEQLQGTLDKHYAGQADLHLAAVDLAANADTVRWEASRGGDLFPHLYATLRLETVVAYSPLHWHEDGTVQLPVTG